MCMCRRRKLDAKAEKCILVGYSDEQKGYKSYNPRTEQARVSQPMAHIRNFLRIGPEVRAPGSYAEATTDANWRGAMEEEMNAVAENETWDLVDAPKGVKPIGCRWYLLNTSV